MIAPLDVHTGAEKGLSMSRVNCSGSAGQQHEEMGFFIGWGIVLDQLVEYAKTLMP